MTMLKLGPIADEKPVKLAIEVPAEIYRDLEAYAAVHAEATGQASAPAKLVVPMIAQFMATDRGFATVKRSRR